MAASTPESRRAHPKHNNCNVCIQQKDKEDPASQFREIIKPSITDLTKEVRTNILCTVEGCGKILPNTPALNMHLVKSHRVKVPQQSAKLSHIMQHTTLLLLEYWWAASYPAIVLCICPFVSQLILLLNKCRSLNWLGFFLVSQPDSARYSDHITFVILQSLLFTLSSHKSAHLNEKITWLLLSFARRSFRVGAELARQLAS